MKKAGKEFFDKRNKRLLFGIGIFLLALIALLMNIKSQDQIPEVKTVQSEPNNDIVDGVHVRTGLKEAQGLNMVIAHCTACHSAQLIIQNRMSEERWRATIRWMQETQNLWDLGDNQDVIINYLVENYPVQKVGRRKNLENIEWYDLN